jgi:hypothetical protein
MAESESSGASRSITNSLHSDRSANVNEVIVKEEAANRGVNINKVQSAVSSPSISPTPGAVESASALIVGDVVLASSAPDTIVVDGQGRRDLVINQLMLEAVVVVARENLKEQDLTEGELSAASKSALYRLHFKLPLRTIADIENAEKVLSKSQEQYEELCRFLYCILEVSAKGYRNLMIQIPNVFCANAAFC